MLKIWKSSGSAIIFMDMDTIIQVHNIFKKKKYHTFNEFMSIMWTIKRVIKCDLTILSSVMAICSSKTASRNGEI